MSTPIQGFPDDRDRQLQREAERTGKWPTTWWNGPASTCHRASETDFEITADEEFALYRLRRLASNLCRSASVPVAAAFYGASQVGKSLFVGRVLEPADARDSPLGKCDQVGPPAYVRELVFHLDINPQCGGNEATALVTRFTTKERFDETALPGVPRQGPGPDPRRMAARAGPRVSLRVQAAHRHHLARRASCGSLFEEVGRRSMPPTPSTATGAWTCWTCTPTCAPSIRGCTKSASRCSTRFSASIR